MILIISLLISMLALVRFETSDTSTLYLHTVPTGIDDALNTYEWPSLVNLANSTPQVR